MSEKITYSVQFPDGGSCGHNHRTRKAAEKCKERCRGRAQAAQGTGAGRAWGVRRYHNGIEG